MSSHASEQSPLENPTATRRSGHSCSYHGEGSNDGPGRRVGSTTLPYRDFTDLLEMADARVLEVLARDEELPSAHYELLVQLANETVAGTLLQNYSVPESALRLLLERFPEYEDMVRAHPDSPDAWKLDLPNEHVTTEALSRFFRRMKATRSERDRMLRRWSKDGQRCFGDCWAEVRPSSAP